MLKPLQEALFCDKATPQTRQWLQEYRSFYEFNGRVHMMHPSIDKQGLSQRRHKAFGIITSFLDTKKPPPPKGAGNA